MVTKIQEGKDIYTYRVTWSPEDSEYVGLCAEFPSLSWLADNKIDALRGISEVVAEVIVDMQSNNEPIPKPIATKRYSGNFTVRIPPDVHREIATLAAEANISLNRFISYKLASH